MRARTVLISIAIHGCVLAGILWMTSRRASVSQHPVVFRDAPPDSVGGIAGLKGLAVRPPEAAPSLPPGEAKDYVGQYSVAYPRQADRTILISHVNNGGDHWSLLVDEGRYAPYKLTPVARDTFAVSLAPARSIVFIRRDSAVLAIELHYSGTIRRGVKVPGR